MRPVQAKEVDLGMRLLLLLTRFAWSGKDLGPGRYESHLGGQGCISVFPWPCPAALPFGALWDLPPPSFGLRAALPFPSCLTMCWASCPRWLCPQQARMQLVQAVCGQCQANVLCGGGWA